MKGKVKRILSGMLSVMTILTSIVQPITTYAAVTEPEPAAYEAEYPALEEVRDKLAEDEIVKVQDYEVEAGGGFDVKSDFSGMEINKEKVKITFHEAKNEAGQDFDGNRADSYKAVYFVEPVSGNPRYHVIRHVVVKEPVKEAGVKRTASPGEQGNSGESESEDADEPEPHSEVFPEVSEEPVGLQEPFTEAVTGEPETEGTVSGTETNGTSESTGMEDSTGAAETEVFTEAVETSDETETEESAGVPEAAENFEPVTEPETDHETETEMESETETETESETEKEGKYEVKITSGAELGITLNHEDGSYDAGETVTFSTNLPEGCLTAVGALKAESNAKGDTADILYSEVTYHADTNTFSFAMPAEDVALNVTADYEMGGIMLLAAAEDTPWDEATEIEANTYYYYSDGQLHPFNSVMGSGGNDSYKYVRYKANGKTYTVNAYCMQHSMPSPPSGTTYKNMVELDEGGDDKYLRKALFYGYGGPGWGKTFNGYNIKTIMEKAGCTSETRAMQHYLVDYLYDGESGFGGALSTTAKNMLGEIKAALKGMPDPTAMSLLPGLSVTANGRDTETFTWKANEAFQLTIHLEDGVKLVNETTGKSGTGNVTVKGGDKFHLTATAENISKLKGKYEVTSNYPLDFHAMLLKLQSSQDIGFGYYTDSSGISLQVDWPEQAKLKIVKQDGSSGKKLAGAVYGVYSDEACQNLIVKMPATDTNGTSSVAFNVVGSTVYLKEITPPKGYKLNVSAVGVKVSAGNTSTQTVTDTEILGSLKIYKEGEVLTGAVSNADGTTFQYGKRRLAGAVYTVTAAEDIVSADGTVVWKKGAVVAEHVVTGADGAATVENLHLGKYIVTETGAPENYVNKGESREVTVSSDGKEEAVLGEVTFVNDRQKAEVEAVKQDKETSSPLAGGVFALYAESDIQNADGAVVVPKDTLIGKATTGKDGHGKFAADLPVGYGYYVKEIQAPDKFLLNTADVYHFSFAYAGQKETLVKFTHTFTNNEPRASLTIYKEGEVLAGASVTENGTVFQYELRKQKGAAYDVYAGEDIRTAAGKLIYQKGALVAENLVTGADGSVTLSDLYLGTYTVKEKKAPANFVNRGEAKNITLSYNGQTESVVLGNVTFTNDRQKAAVIVKKVDDTTKNPLSGGIYGLYAAEDIKTADGKVAVKKDTFIDKASTGSDGSASYKSDLPIGYSYYVKEIQAPDGYLRNTEDSYTFRFDYTREEEASVHFSHTFENERVNAKISLVKKDAETGSSPQGDAVLEKAVYGLFAREDIVHPDKKTGVIYKAGTQVAVLTTDAEGKAFAEGLYLGKYYVKEIKPSSGYLLDEKEYDLSCDFEGDLVATVEREATSLEQVIKQPFQLIKAANNGKTDADLLSGAGFTAYLVSSLKTKEDGSYDFDSAVPAVIGENGATEIFTDNKGHAVSIAIPFGTYIVRETTTPHNYTPVDDFTVRITEHKPDTPQVWRVLLDDEFEAKLKIVKQDDETKKPVLAKNTEFKVYDLDHEEYVEQVTTYPITVTHKSYFTDEQGYLILPQNLKIGHYRIEEVRAPYGYTLNENYYEVTVDSNTAYHQDKVSKDVIIEVVYENHPVKGELKVVKKGEVIHGFEDDFTYGKETLAGAVFEVYAAEDIYTADFQKDSDGKRILEYAAGTLVAALTTDEKGEAVLKDLPLGSYKVVEKKAPEGFVLNEAPQTVTFSYADQETPVVKQTVEFENDRQKVEVSVVKKDAKTGAVIAGAEFGLYAKGDISANGKVIVKAGTLLGKAVTGEDGKAVFALDLPFGEYAMKELTAPAGYVSSDQVVEVTASYQGQDVKVVKLASEFQNEPTVVSVKKTDLTTGVELSGATLTVLDKDGNVVDTWKSVKGEEHLIKRLVVGETYTLREELAPYGYLQAEEITFTVEDAEIQKVEMKDAVPKGLLLINKEGEFMEDVSALDSIGGWIAHLFEYVSGSLKDVTFEVYALEDIKAADGESADYYKKDELIAEITTDDTGVASLGNLPLGKYYVKEKETAEGYVLDGEIREIDLTYRDQHTAEVTYSFDWQNNRQKVEVSVLKKEKDSDRVLEGAVFALSAKEDITNKDGKVIMEAGTVIEEKATDKDGKLSFAADLPIGFSYSVKETVPAPGFATASGEQEFTFTYEDSQKETVTYELIFVDEPTVFEFTKTSLTDGKEVEGAKLQVTDESGKVVDEWVSGKEPYIIKELTVGKKYTMTEVLPADGYATAESITFTVEDTAEVQKIEMKDDVTKVEITKTDLTDGKELPGAKLKVTDSEGKVVDEWTSGEEPHRIEKLVVGKEYVLTETLPADGYVTAESITFTVKDTAEVQKIEMKDDVTKVEVTKTDLTDGKELPGAKLKVTDIEGKVVDEWTSGEESHRIEKLVVGKEYVLTETLPADGYVTAESITFTVEDTAEVQKIEMKDDVTKVEISKTDISGKELPGAKLTILDKDGKVVESWTSTDKPYYIEKLPVGKYTLREESAPEGYLVAEDVKFEVKDTGEIQKVVMKDEVKPEETPETPETPQPSNGTPKTGDDTHAGLWLLLCGLALAGLAGSVVLLRRKKK